MRLLALVIVAAIAGAAHAETDLDTGLAALDVEAYRDRPVLIAEVTGKFDWLSLFETHPAEIQTRLVTALAHHGFHAKDNPGVSVRDPDDGAAQLLAGDPKLGGVLLFQLEGRWGTPHVHVWLRMRSGNSVDIELAPPNDGLVTLAPWRIGVLALVVIVPIGLLGMLSRRRQKTLPLYRGEVRPIAPRAKDEAIPISVIGPEVVPEIAPAPAPVVPQRRVPGSIALLGSAATPARIRGRYRVMSELGRGAMGVVYRAYDEGLEREVAVKVMSEQIRDHPQALKLFGSEGKMLAQLNHPNIIAIYDQIGDHDEAMLVMELVDGTTLDRALATVGRYEWRVALGLIDQLCAGLAYAHGKNMIHRDIKPPNIFITTKGDLKLGDFGLARVVRALAIQSTELRGTPMYMAPEQITGAALDQRADLYAVGCTLFELVSGRPVFTDGNPMFQHVSTPPPDLTALVPDLPPDVVALVTTLIAKSPDERPPSADAVRARIAVILA